VQHQPERALTYLQRAERLAAQSGDEASISLINAQLAALYSRMGRSEEALPLIEEALPQAKRQDRFALLDIYGNILLRQGDLDKAEACFEEMTAANDLQVQLDAYNGLTQIAAQKHRTEDYLPYFNQYRLLTDSLRRTTATESVSRMNALYDYQLREQENAALKLQNQQRLMLLIGVLALAAMVILGLMFYFRYHRLKMKQKLAYVQGLLREHMEREVQREQRELMENHIKNSHVMKHLLESLDTEKPLSETDVAEIEDLLNEVSPAFLPLLKQLGEMTDIEYQVSLLIKLGMSPIQISSLVLRDKSSVSAIRRRLYKKITGQEGNPIDWDNIILSL
jgi:tetratricopeptide (TPR) repeat protein